MVEEGPSSKALAAWQSAKVGAGAQESWNMADRRPLERADIEQAFQIMGEYLAERKVLGEIAIYGGSAILFQFDWRRTSEDVDARVIGAADHGLVMRAAEAAARQLDLPRSWLNETVTMYVRRLEQDGDRIFVGVYPSAQRAGLRVVAASRLISSP
jgi:hypothetical protein